MAVKVVASAARNQGGPSVDASSTPVGSLADFVWGSRSEVQIGAQWGFLTRGLLHLGWTWTTGLPAQSPKLPLSGLGAGFAWDWSASERSGRQSAELKKSSPSTQAPKGAEYTRRVRIPCNHSDGVQRLVHQYCAQEVLGAGRALALRVNPFKKGTVPFSWVGNR
jgi:hypothetical protein